MQQIQGTRQTTKRAVEEVIELPTASLSDTADAQDLLDVIDELLEG
jgi:hypothetical protein